MIAQFIKSNCLVAFLVIAIRNPFHCNYVGAFDHYFLKVKKSKSKETMTNEAEKADRWTSMSSQTQVKDKGITAALKAPSKSIATSVSRKLKGDIHECRC